MKDQIVSFETAKLAKEKGFDIPTVEYYYNKDTKTVNHKKGIYSAPTQSLLQRWLREKYLIRLFIINYYDSYAATIRVGVDVNRDGDSLNILEKSYEEALEKALQSGLKLIS